MIQPRKVLSCVLLSAISAAALSAVALSAVALSAVALLPRSARAENLFITSDTTVAGTVTDTNYLVGKDTGLNTLPGSITLNVTGNVFPDNANGLFGPYGYMYDINVFGAHKANISGSTQGLRAYDNSVNTLAGGFVQNYRGYDSAAYTINGGISNSTWGFINSLATLNSGQINSWQSFQNAILNVTGGTVSDATLNDTSTLNLSGGSITSLTVNPGSVVNVTGTGTITNRSGGGTVNFNNVTIPTVLPLSGTTVTSLNNVTVEKITADENATVIVNNDSSVPAVNIVEVSGTAKLQADRGTINKVRATSDVWFAMNGITPDAVHALEVVMADTTHIDLSNGLVDTATLTGEAKATILTGGHVGTVSVNGTTGQVQLTVAGGKVDTAKMAGDIKAKIESGSVDSLTVADQVEAVIGTPLTEKNALSVKEIVIKNTAVATVSAGVISKNTIHLFDEGVLNLYGTDLTLLPAGPGVDSFGSFSRFILSGTLQNGDPLNNINVLSYAGALPTGDPALGAANPGSVRFLSVPEAASVTLLGTAFFLLVAARSQRRRVSGY